MTMQENFTLIRHNFYTTNVASDALTTGSSVYSRFTALFWDLN